MSAEHQAIVRTWRLRGSLSEGGVGDLAVTGSALSEREGVVSDLTPLPVRPSESEHSREPIRTKTGRVKGYRTHRILDCSCGQRFGTSLDFIEAQRIWRAHKALTLSE